MKKNYSRFGYNISYDFDLTCKGKHISDKHKDRACFGSLFGVLIGKDIIYTGKYTLYCRKTFTTLDSNFCALEKQDILKLLRYMRRVFEIQVHLVESKDWYTFVLNVTGKPIKHKWVLTFCRVFYEFPFNEIACDVIKLRKQGIINGIDFTHKGFLELFYLISISYKNSVAVYNGHALFGYPPSEVPIKTLKESFNIGLHRVQDVYPGNYYYFKEFKVVPKYTREIDWDTNFEERLEYYIKNFYILKNLRKNEKGVRRRARKVV